MKKKVLIIGQNSYIGNSFKNYVGKLSQLEKNHRDGTEIGDIGVVNGCLDSCKLQIEAISARNNQWQSTDLSQYDAILHVAAIVHQKETEDKRQLYIDVNEKLPVEIAKKAKQAGVKQFIFLSTMAVYGEVEGAITENTPLKPTTMYGKTKLAAEQQLQKLASDQFKITILRPPMVYGENCPGNYTRLKKLAKVLPIFPDVDNKRSMIHVDTLCQCIVEIIGQEIDLQDTALRGTDSQDTATSKKTEILHPQDKRPVKTTDLYVKLRSDMGKKTYTTKLFNGLVIVAKGKVGAVRKLFGSCYYEMD